MLLADPRLNTANHKDEYGDTPAMYTMTHEFAKRYVCINVLRELVADPSVDLDIRDGDGKSLEEVAGHQSLELEELEEMARWVLQQ